MNLISHPMLWAVSLNLTEAAQLIMAEVAVAGLEGLLIFAMVQRDPGPDTRAVRFGWSLLCAVGVNALSLLVGLLVLPLIPISR